MLDPVENCKQDNGEKL